MSRSHHTGRADGLPVTQAVIASLSFLIVAFVPVAAHAASWGTTQHGGRATAQAGAFVARADDPSAVSYNPAGIARLEGFQLQLGADGQRLEVDGRAGGLHIDFDEATDVLPAAYLTYHLPGGADRVVLGLGFDSPNWTSLRSNYEVPQIASITRESDAELWQIHPVVAIRLTDRWSLGGGLRYVTGDLTYRSHDQARIGDLAGPLLPFEVTLEADGSADDLGFDLGLQYAAPRWGWGAVYRQGVSLTTEDRPLLNLDLPGLPGLPDGLGDLSSVVTKVRQTFELPDQAVVGGWLAPRPTLRLELDVAYAGSTTNLVRFQNPPGVPGDPFENSFPISSDARDQAWSVRLGAEQELGPRWQLSAGLAWEQSPTASSRASGVAPWGDAMVYALGASYRLPSVAFDLGYSYWDHDALEGRSTDENGFVVTTGRFESSEQILSVSARWHF